MTELIFRNGLTLLIIVSGIVKSFKRFETVKLNASESDYKVCPKFSCVQGIGYSECAFSFPRNSDVNIYILKGQCKTDQFCKFDISKIIEGNYHKNFYCEDKCERKTLSYPGEICEKDSDCLEVKDYGECWYTICAGLYQGAFCKETSQCMAGNYCDLNTGRCSLQLYEGSSCNSTIECRNNLVCNNNKCIKAYSIHPGLPADSDEACQYGVMKNKVCEKIKYENSSSGFLTCNFGELCYYQYQYSNEVFTRPCECGYNSGCQGYCPIDHYTNENYWLKYYQKLGELLDNKNHTLHRQACKVSSELDELTTKTIYAHKFYSAVDCSYEFVGIEAPGSFFTWILIIIICGSIILISLLVYTIYCCIKNSRKRYTEKREGFLEVGRNSNLYDARNTSDITCCICFAAPKEKKINCESPIDHALCKGCYRTLINTDKIKLCPFCRTPIKY